MSDDFVYDILVFITLVVFFLSVAVILGVYIYE